MNPEESVDSGPLPLTMPPTLWAGLGHDKRALFRRAQAVLDCLVVARELDLVDAAARVGEELAKVAPAVRLLAVIGLVEMRRDGTLILKALPGEHLEITGPDGKRRWVFVTCPVDAKPGLLN